MRRDGFHASRLILLKIHHNVRKQHALLDLFLAPGGLVYQNTFLTREQIPTRCLITPGPLCIFYAITFPNVGLARF